MKRSEQWPKLLYEFIEERRFQPFAWSSNDCCIFAADWVRLCTGQDFADEMRGRYSSALGAFRILVRHRGIIGLVSNHAKLTPVPLRMMQRGDIVACESRTGLALGIGLGPVAAFVNRDGLIFPDVQLLTHCWTF
jgi:hypothetical protein